MLKIAFLALFAEYWAPSQNAILFSSETAVELKLAGEDVEGPCEVINEWIDKTRVAPGLFKRTPTYGDITSHDNYIGHALSDLACKNGISKEIAEALAKTGWAFNDAKPGEYDPRGQLTPKDIVPIKLLAGWKPTPLEALYASLDLFIGRSWNLKRSRILVYENTEMDLLTSIIIMPGVFYGKRMVDYKDAGCNYHNTMSPKGQDSLLCEAIKSSNASWKFPK